MHDAVESMLAFFGEYRDVAMIGATCVSLTDPAELEAAAKVSSAYASPALPLTYSRPEDVLGYRGPTDLNMTHSSSCFLRAAWDAVGGYRPDKKRRLVPYSDRDFQLRVNAVWPVAVADKTPYAFWRSYSSVDRVRNS
jgi:GT2 family glycosyltransferase